MGCSDPVATQRLSEGAGALRPPSLTFTKRNTADDVPTTNRTIHLLPKADKFTCYGQDAMKPVRSWGECRARGTLSTATLSEGDVAREVMMRSLSSAGARCVTPWPKARLGGAGGPASHGRTACTGASHHPSTQREEPTLPRLCNARANLRAETGARLARVLSRWCGPVNPQGA
jgi:hypothetical protein